MYRWNSGEYWDKDLPKAFDSVEILQDPYSPPREPWDEVPAVLKVFQPVHGVEITLLNQADSDFTVDVRLWGNYYHNWSVAYPISSNTVSLTIPAHQTRSVQLSLTGFPEFVTKGTFDFYVDYTHYIEFFNIDWYQNIAPATQSQAEAAWIEVLEDACAWSTENTTFTECVWDDTFGIFFSQQLVYNGEAVYYWQDGHPRNPGVPSTYNLSKLVKDLQNQPYVNVDCRDVSGFNAIVNNSLGIPVAFKRLFAVNVHSEISGWPFWTNPICKIGDDPTISGNYDQVWFAFHQVCETTIGTADACLAFPVDLGGNGYQNPPADWPLQGYWQTWLFPLTPRGLAFSLAVLNPDGNVNENYIPPIEQVPATASSPFIGEIR